MKLSGTKVEVTTDIVCIEERERKKHSNMNRLSNLPKSYDFVAQNEIIVLSSLQSLPKNVNSIYSKKIDAVVQ